MFDSLFEIKQYQKVKKKQLANQWKENNLLFTAWNGEPMNPNTPYHWLKKFCQRNDIPFYGIHSLRHLNASLLIKSGIDVNTVSEFLGHSNTTTTLNTYTHMFNEQKAICSNAIADALDL